MIVNGDTLHNPSGRKWKLRWNQQNIVIKYAGLSYTSEDAVRYIYMLEGADTKWSYPAKERSISYSNLSPGQYIFKVKAGNATGTWSAEAAAVSFTIATPWYNTVLFYTFCFLLALTLVYSLYKYRLKKELEILRVRQRLSADLHDEIGSALSSISLLSMAARHEVHVDQEKAVTLTEKIGNTSGLMIQQLNDIIWSVKPGNDTLDQTLNRVREFMSDVLAAKQITFTLQAPDTEQLVLPAELRRDFYLACREIINNTAKYSGATHFKMRVEIEKGMLMAVLSDNGCGFNEKELIRISGLSNVRNRMAKNRGTATLNTHSNGVTWHIQVPIK
jgi:signal transduction histidine kinase